MFISAASFSSCAERPSQEEASETYAFSYYAEEEIAGDANIISGPRTKKTAMVENHEASEPFSSYTFELMNYEDKYLITIEGDADANRLDIAVEDNEFILKNYNITPPLGYSVIIPSSQERASDICRVIRNNGLSSEIVPDVIQVEFYNSTAGENFPLKVSELYAINPYDKKLNEITLYDSGEPVVDDLAQPAVAFSNSFAGYAPALTAAMDYTSDTELYHSEPYKFMAEPQTYIREDGMIDAKVYTYAFDPLNLMLVKSEEACDMNSILYYGYYTRAVSGELYKYFTVSSFNITDYDNYVEIPVPNEDSDLFFKVDDERFSTLSELKSYVKSYFSDDLVSEMFLDAPQKYRDIDGRLHTVLGSGGTNPLLGKLVITDFEVIDNTIVYKTRQERLDETGAVSGFIDGEYIIEVKNVVEEESGGLSEIGFRVLKYN